jgi:senataxin
VCAPSNAAVDELVMRLKGGIKTLTGEFHKLSVVRLGRSDNINANVLDVTLDELVNVKLNLASGKKASTGDDVGKLMLNHKAICEELNTFLKQLDEWRSKGQGQTPEQSQKVEQLKRKKQELSHSIDLLRDNGHTAARDAEINRRQAQQEILDGAHVLCATLSGSGHDMFQNLNIEFETVIIDEAAQSIELSALIPLKYGCAKCIMVGDPKQLPPTVLSREAARFQYEQSLFVRMQSNRPNDVHLLDTQYRMHPEISRFPSRAFYEGRLLDGPNMAKTRTRPWHGNSVLGPYRFFDVQGAHQSAPRGHSLINVAELEVALQLFERLITDYKGYDFTGKVGIITPYKSQLAELRARFVRKYGDDIFKTIEFNTTDAFQGRESEIIIFSCVRASAGRGIGFLSDIRRMNVGITRAKSSLWVLGNSQSLMQGEFWASLIDDAKRRNRYTQGNLLEILRKPGLLPGVTVQAGLASESDSSPASHDIDMSDAPVLGQLAVLDSTPSHLPGDADMFDPAQVQDVRTRPSDALRSQGPGSVAYRPSGGNGFNTNAMCNWCGSYRHMTLNCDNEEALKVKGRCYRCRSPHHNVTFCTTERCIECGEFGHQAAGCPKTESLSSSEKERLVKAEAAHQRTLRRAPELQRKRQMGDHDKAVPIVKSTRRTPPLAIQGPDRKRKRASSPPLHAPKGSITALGDSGRGRNGDTRIQTHPPPSRPRDVNVAQSQPRPPPSHVGADPDMASKPYGSHVRPLQEIAKNPAPANETEVVGASRVWYHLRLEGWRD